MTAATTPFFQRFSSAWRAFRQPDRALPAGPAKTKQVGPAGAKVSVSARRPTFEAAAYQPILMRLWTMGPRATSRTRNVLEMLRQIRDYSPDVAKAVDNWITLANPGYSLNVYFAKQQDEGGEPVVDEEGLWLIQQFATRMCSEYSGAWDEIAGGASEFPGLDTFVNMIHLTAATQGAMAAEVELSESLDDIVDVYPVDPSVIDFRLDPETNRIRPGMLLQGPFRFLDPIRFRYVGKDPDIYLPGGRSPLLAVLDTVFFQQQVMRELQAIAHMSNMPRLDVKVLQETATKILQETRSDLMQPGQEDARQKFLDGFLTDIQATINSLEADDAFVHWDAAEVNYVSPGATAIPVKDLMDAIDRMIISGVKQLPILLGRNEGATTTHATVQWQVFIRQLGGYQRLSKTLVTWALNLYLRIQGRQSYVTFEYEEHKTTDELVEAQTLNISANTWKQMVNNGWATNDEAAQACVGHPAVGLPIPVEAPPAPPEAPPRTEPPEGGTSNLGNGRVTIMLDGLPVDQIRQRLEQAKAAKNGSSGHGSHLAVPLDQARNLSEVVGGLPAWLQRQHHDTLHDYRQWRESAIVPRFSQAAHAVNHGGAAIKTMQTGDAQRWLHGKLSVGEPDRNRLNETLRQGGRRVETATLEAQLRAINKPASVKLTDRTVLRAIDDRARDNARSITDTYNADLLAAIRATLVDQGRADMISRLRDALLNLMHWERLRNAWKEVQVAVAETQSGVMHAVEEFFARNEVEGQAEVYPYEAAEEVCQGYIDDNPYGSMSDLLTKCRLPAHPHCVHGARLVDGGTVSGPIWAGG